MALLGFDKLPASPYTLTMRETDQTTELTPAQKFLAAVKLQELGLQMKRTQFKRRHPEATEIELDDMLRKWLFNRDSVPEGFRRVDWPRK